MRRSESFSHLKPWKLSQAALFGCLLIMTVILVCLIKSGSNTIVTLNLQLSSYSNMALPMEEELKTGGQGGLPSTPASFEEAQLSDESLQGGKEAAILPHALKEKQDKKEAHEDAATSLTSTTMEDKELDEPATGGNQTVTLQLQHEDKHGGGDSNKVIKLPPVPKEKQREEETTAGLCSVMAGNIKRITKRLIKESRVVCDFTAPRSDICSMDGDVRVLGRSSIIMLASPPTDRSPTENTTWKIRPYPRKWESTMELIKELTVTVAAEPEKAPRCMINHGVPAVFFSTGGFVGNYFHDFTDVIIPLFMMARRFNGEVQLVVTDFNYQFMAKYQQILRHLSHYPAINLDADDRVHCFPHAHVGLHSHRALGIDASKSPNGISMSDFRDFLRKCFSLKRKYSEGIDLQSRRKPRLLLILRRGSRSFVNERQVMRMVKGLGFKLITAGPEETKNISRFAQMVNSVDVLMGIHGAGLTNMVFLPSNATLVQIIPCCDLAKGCRYIFAEPAPDMGIRYVEYEIRVEESSLIEKYPRDDVLFRDPLSIQKQLGFNAFWNIFLNQQKGLQQPGRKRSLWRSSLEMQVRPRSIRMEMMDMEMKILDGFLLFFVVVWFWNVAGRRFRFFWSRVL
ncbi:alpha-1,3-arabinosyltransferase XAT3-like isoform X3 [Musa acuminata AAA Group]|uniref:alpha-1,3-arabinosyltransferase XAT3-like isoform X3 n=1 Tax=Musa acuminata AAA Group TaxID=214697 RepID=UPI0031DB5665